MVTALTTTSITTRATTIRAMRAASTGVLLCSRAVPDLDPLASGAAGHAPRRASPQFERLADDGGRAVDLEDAHPRADLEGVVELRAGRPLVGTDLDAATGTTDGPGDDGGAAHQRLHAVDLLRRPPLQVGLGDRPHAGDEERRD